MFLGIEFLAIVPYNKITKHQRKVRTMDNLEESLNIFAQLNSSDQQIIIDLMRSLLRKTYLQIKNNHV